MKCPVCANEESRVLDSRSADDHERIRRRRECLKCAKRFTTYEAIEHYPLIVIKKDKNQEAFDRNKLIRGLVNACANRPIEFSTIEGIVNDIENHLQNLMVRETTSLYLGELAMEQLKNIDEVSYIRFASVYREFNDIHSFLDELSKLLDKKSD